MCNFVTSIFIKCGIPESINIILLIKESKMRKVLDPIVQYFQNTKLIKKLEDAAIICLLMLIWGIATGHIKLPVFNRHSVLTSYNTSASVQSALNKHFSKDDKNTFAARFLFHNGVESINGSFKFIKFSMLESVSMEYLNINPTEWKDIPYSVDLNMIDTLLKGKCYFAIIQHNYPLYTHFNKLNTRSIGACPLFDNKGHLEGFVMIGRSDVYKVDEAIITNTTKEIQNI